MTRQSTWTNADGLVVGFGPNLPERNVSGIYYTDGVIKEAVLQVTYQSSGAVIPIPAGSAVLDVLVSVGTAWVGGTKLEIGDATDPDGWISATQGATANLTAGAELRAGGAYAIGTTDGSAKALAKVYATATNLTATITGTFTSGTATVVVRYA